MKTDYKAMPKTWATVAQFAANGDELTACVMELLSRVQRLENGATCPHIVSSDEGTSYCGLAEQTARIGQPDVPANTSPPTGSLMDVVRDAIRQVEDEDEDDDDPGFKYTSAAIRIGQGLLDLQASAAIRAVAEWLREQHDGDPVAATALEREAKR